MAEQSTVDYPTGSLPESNITLGPLLLPVLETDGTVRLQSDNFSYSTATKLREAIIQLGIDPKIRKAIRSDQHTDTPNGLFSTPTSGRSEMLLLASSDSALRLFSREDTKDVNDKQRALEGMKTVLALIQEKLSFPLPREVLLKVKGRGPSSFKVDKPESVLGDNFFIQKQSITGFTGEDRMDIEIGARLAGIDHAVVGLDGETKTYRYIPSRILLGLLPIRGIYKVPKSEKNEEKIQVARPEQWKEPLYLEIFVELGGYNFDDIILAKEKKLITDQQLVDYALTICTTYGAAIHHTDSYESKRVQLSRFLLEKAWCDAQVENKYLVIGANRSKHNFTVGGDQDWDDSVWRKDSDPVSAPELYFLNKVHNSFKSGLLLEDHVLESIEKIITRNQAVSMRSGVVEEIIRLTALFSNPAKVKVLEHVLKNGNLGDMRSRVFSTLSRATYRLDSENKARMLQQIVKNQDLGDRPNDVYKAVVYAAKEIGDTEFMYTVLKEVLERAVSPVSVDVLTDVVKFVYKFENEFTRDQKIFLLKKLDILQKAIDPTEKESLVTFIAVAKLRLEHTSD